MGNWWNVLGLLLYKNCIVRARHWGITIFLQILLPILLFVLTQAVRDFSADTPTVVEETTFYPIESKNELINKISGSLITLYFVPNNDYTREFMNLTKKCLRTPNTNITGFDTENEMIDAYLLQKNLHPYREALAVIFETDHKQFSDKQFKYKIRHSSMINNNLFIDINEGIAEFTYLSKLPFLQLQLCLDESFINRVVQNFTFKPMVSIQRMPYPPYVKVSQADIILRTVITTFAVIIFAIPLCIESTYAAKEKAIGVMTLMSMNGVSIYQNLLSWLITGIVCSIFYVVPITVLFKIAFTTHVDPFLYYSDASLFWLLMTVHVAHLIAFGIHVAAYFCNPRYVVIVLSIIYTASFSLHESLVKEDKFAVIPYLGILLPNILLAGLFKQVNTYESKMVGIHWNNMFIPGDVEYTVIGTTGFILIFSIFGLILHFVLSVYVNNIRPGKYGVPKELLYFLKYSRNNKVFLDEEVGDINYDNCDSDDFEAVPNGILIPGIQIRGLKKCYTSWLRKSKVHALKGVSIDFYKGQITALLGHNGAGKTTLMSIITGVTNETEGKVFINGKNLKCDLETIRNDLGLCPQENMVFPDLNVFEQIEFFGLLKNKDKSQRQINHQVNVLLEKLKLTDKRNCPPNKLSGGQKRRLCLGMALIGNASTLILDEPTSGMDPETRRDTWDLILKMRGEKTIIISTHNMEEADILGDRIAIIQAGQLRSYGTSMFLKKQHGHGYIEVTLSTKPSCDPKEVIKNFDVRSQVIIDTGKMILNVPYTDALPNALDKVENEKKNLGVTGISVSLITLEQVFLKIISKDDNGKRLNELSASSIKKVKGWTLHMQMIQALFVKKLIFTWKNLYHFLLIMFLPLLAVLFMSLSYNIATDSLNVVPLNLDMYRNPEALYSSQHPGLHENYAKVIRDAGGTVEAITNGMSVTNALLNFANQDIAKYRNHFVISAEFNVSKDIVFANGFYSGTMMHSIPLTMNFLSNALIKSFAGSEYFIEVSRQKLPDIFTYQQRIPPEIESLPRVIIFCLFLFPTLALFSHHPFDETTTKVKQLQRMTGVSSFTYWITMLLFDVLVCLMSMLLILLGLYVMDFILDIHLYRTVEIPITLLLLVLMGLNGILLAYIFSFMNKSKYTVTTILTLAPLGLVIVQYLVHLITETVEALESLHIVQKRLLRSIPYISFFHGLLDFFSIATENARCRRFPKKFLELCAYSALSDICCEMQCEDGVCKKPLKYFSDANKDLEENIIYLGLMPIVYFTILILMEENFFVRLFTKIHNKSLRDECDSMDEQVKKEKYAVALEINKMNNKNNRNDVDRVTMNETRAEISRNIRNESESLFLVYELSKSYGKLVAVKEVNFCVKQHECFGLLGVNGAGKSTTFRMLTGEEIPNSGTMYLKDAEIYSNKRQYLKEMGYCPQTDALIDSLNTFDHLRLFAYLRGIPKAKVDLEVNKWIDRLNLHACKLQPSGTYSGGNKRRLNIALALIGNPALVLLDEPTTGVDPAARRSLWTILQACQAAGQAIILTSHSMEECEALCNRLVIMVKGQLVCIGASQELKQRFGAGYDIHIKLDPSRSNEDVKNIKNTIESSLRCEIRDENLGFISYHVTDPKTTWTKMYGTMTELKNRYTCIQDYSVLSATLEQLFIQFARGIVMPEHETSPKHSISSPTND